MIAQLQVKPVRDLSAEAIGLLLDAEYRRNMKCADPPVDGYWMVGRYFWGVVSAGRPSANGPISFNGVLVHPTDLIPAREAHLYSQYGNLLEKAVLPE